MKVFETIQEIREYLDNERQKNGCSVGFVPTMGALHSGHTSIIRQAGRENNLVVCSIFVNPKQFGNIRDLEKYPRNLDNDLRILSNVRCDIVFAPSVDEMYPDPVNEEYNFEELEETMEGKYRKGHFKGVAIVVKRLLEIVEPDRVYFGKKDYQQLLIVKKLVEKTGLPVEVVACNTVREPDGLAFNSRNQRLTPQQRKDAAVIYKTLVKASGLYLNNTPFDKIKQMVANEINAVPTLRLEYFEIADPENLKPLKNYTPGQKSLGCIAVYAGDIRLIDNMIF